LSAQPSLEERITAKFAGNFEAYSKRALFIRKKDASTGTLAFNECQRRLHEKAEEQLRRRGKVRLIVLKCRQFGSSTYFAARGYHRTTFRRGYRAFVLTHLDDATDNIFGVIKRFHENVPDLLRPITGASNAKELVFSRLDSGYRVSTAGNKAAGRGHTLQIFHGSEVAHWPNASEHVAGVMQAIADAPGTEVWLESTANGKGNIFHTMWTAAQAGKGDFEGIFIPWYWHEEYRKEPDEMDWRAPKELADYADMYGLDRHQTYWAYQKNLELSRACSTQPDEICWLFRQEYPGNAEEAFQTSGANSFIPGDLVMRARKRSAMGSGPVVLGVDVARGGDDMSAILDRQGRRMGGHICKKVDYGKDTMPLVAEVVRLVRELRRQGVPLRKVFVDATGVGGPVYDRLREQLGDELVGGVEFGGSPRQKDRYFNRRAEMWDELRQWLAGDVPVGVPDNDELQTDLCAPAWGPGQMTRHRSDNRLVLEEKSHMKQRLKFSPDFGDAAALTFADDFNEFVAWNDSVRPQPGAGAWML